jgi:hypothetical protein
MYKLISTLCWLSPVRDEEQLSFTPIEPVTFVRVCVLRGATAQVVSLEGASRHDLRRPL